MIPKMKKFLFAGTEDEIEEFFSRAQAIGEMEFLSLSNKKPVAASESIKEMVEALKILRRQPVVHQEYVSDFDAKAKVTDILFHNKEMESFHEQIRLIKAEISRIQPFGDFSLEEVETVKTGAHKTLQFFVARHSRLQDQSVADSLIYIQSEYDQDYFLYIGDKPFVHPYFSEVMITTSLADLKKELKRIETLSEEFEKELKRLAIYMEGIKDSLANELSHAALQNAKNLVDFHIEGYLFFVEAWVPENKTPSLLTLTEGLAIFCEEVAIEEGDQVPTYMENKGFGSVGEDLVKVYDIPSIHDADPSSWVFWSFALFFSMIVADAGYGLLYLILAAVLWIKFPKWTGAKKRFQKLLTTLATFSILWGILIGSYFSIQIPPESPINRCSILYYLASKKTQYHIALQDHTYQDWLKTYPEITDAKTSLEVFQKGVVIKDGRKTYELLTYVYDAILLEIALIVGIIHLSLSMLRNLRRSVSGAGWVMFLIGGYLYFPSMLGTETLVQYLGWLSPEVARISGMQLLCAGTAFAVVAALIQEKLGGAGEILKSIQVFSDTLSYLRLYALGMASMIMAVTFNELGEMVGLALGVFIIIIGHAVNITIGVMGGVIHGLRLNFLEWGHYSFEGGGKAFNPLRIIKIGD